MALPDSPVQQPAELPSAAGERGASRQGLGLLTVAAAVAALVFSIMLAGTGAVPESARTSTTTLIPSPVPEASGTLAVNSRSSDDLAAQLPGIGPVYAARIVHARTFFGPLHSAAGLRALGIPDATIKQILPLISFRP